MVSYCKFNECEPVFVPLPTTPEPVFAWLCSGCGARRGACREECGTYIEELVGYWVFEWNVRNRAFKQVYVDIKEYCPVRHRYFSYKKWRGLEAKAKRKHREWERNHDRSKETVSPPIINLT